MMRAIQESTYLKCIIFAFFGKSSEMSRFISTQRTLSSFIFIAIIVSNHFYSWIDYMTLRKDKHWDVFHISIVSPRWSAPTTYLSYDDQHRLIFSNYRKEDKCKHFRRIPSKLKIFWTRSICNNDRQKPRHLPLEEAMKYITALHLSLHDDYRLTRMVTP